MRKKFTVIFKGSITISAYDDGHAIERFYDDYWPKKLKKPNKGGSVWIDSVFEVGDSKSSGKTLYSFEVCFRYSVEVDENDKGKAFYTVTDNFSPIKDHSPWKIEVEDVFSDDWRYLYCPPKKGLLKKWFTDMLKKY